MAVHKPGERKNAVRLLSTLVPAGNINGKPKIIWTYNRYIRKVDDADKVLSFYGDKRKTLKVWKKIEFNIIHRMVLNVCTLYAQHSSDVPKKKRLQFYQEVIEALADEYRADQPQQ